MTVQAEEKFYMGTEYTESTVHSALQGRWNVAYQEIDGQVAGPVATRLEVHGNKFKVEHDREVKHEGTFTLGSGSLPTVVLIYEKSANPLFLGGPRPGVYHLEGDTLKLNFAGVGHSAPHSFSTTPGAEWVLSVYQRES